MVPKLGPKAPGNAHETCFFVLSPMKWTLYQAARELDIHRETLGKALAAIGETVKKGARFHTRVIFRAAKGDLDFEKTLETRERRQLLALERGEKEKRLVDIEAAARLISDSFFPVRQWMMSLPSSAASRCNPSDPQLARDALQRIVDEALPMLRDRMPRPVEAETKLKLG